MFGLTFEQKSWLLIILNCYKFFFMTIQFKLLQCTRCGLVIKPTLCGASEALDICHTMKKIVCEGLNAAQSFWVASLIDKWRSFRGWKTAGSYTSIWGRKFECTNLTVNTVTSERGEIRCTSQCTTKILIAALVCSQCDPRNRHRIVTTDVEHCQCVMGTK